MIKIIDTPQRSEDILNYKITGDIVEITLNGNTESFDFTGMPEGILEDIEVEELSYNPIVEGSKVGNELTLTIIRPYSFEEKYLFEEAEDIGEDTVEETNGN